MSITPLLVLALAIVPDWLLAQDPVRWTLDAPRQVTIGSAISIHVRGSIASGWHIYSLTQGPGGPVPTGISVPTGQPFHLSGPISSTPPRVSFDSNFSIRVEAIEKEALFTVPIAADRGTTPGRHDLRINVRYQVCNARLCNPVHTAKVVAAIVVRRSAAP